MPVSSQIIKMKTKSNPLSAQRSVTQIAVALTLSSLTGVSPAATLIGDHFIVGDATASPAEEGNLTIDGKLLTFGFNTTLGGATFQYQEIGGVAGIAMIANDTNRAGWSWGHDNGSGGVAVQMSLGANNVLSLYDTASIPSVGIALDPGDGSAGSASIKINGDSVLTSGSASAVLSGQGFVKLSGSAGVTIPSDSTINNINIGRGRGGLNGNSTFGYLALQNNTSGDSNSAFGRYSLYSNTSGGSNSSYGEGSMKFNTSGSFNVSSGMQSLHWNSYGNANNAFGYKALFSNSSGSNNSGVGTLSLHLNVSGNSNNAFGRKALAGNTSGSENIAMGTEAGVKNVAGGFNIYLGSYSGVYQADGLTSLTSAQRSIYIGANSRGGNNSDYNSIVIGSDAIGEGANTTVIGNSQTTKTHLFGVTNANSIKVAGTTTLQGQVIVEQPQGDISMGAYQ